MKFIVYPHQITAKDGTIIRRKLIAIKDSYGLLHFTDFHKYCRSPKKSLMSIHRDENSRASFICVFLNYLYNYEEIITLTDITVDMVERFLNLYGCCQLPDDDDNTHRKKETVQRCIDSVTDFCILLIADKSELCHMTEKDLTRQVSFRDSHGKLVTKLVPRFEVRYIDSERTLLRDMPTDAMNVILEYASTHYPQILGLIILCAFAGLRPSEACNVRRDCSHYGAGISFYKVNGKTIDIKIDLRHEYRLRSDNVKVGCIKKERIVDVPQYFLPAFNSYYEFYYEYIKDKPYETEYAPLSINAKGKAMSYWSFYQTFQSLMHEVAPIFHSSGNVDLAMFGQALFEKKVSPHILRHWFTVQLVLNLDLDVPTLMHYRGDKSPESAMVYLQNKGELARKYEETNDKIFNYLKEISDS